MRPQTLAHVMDRTLRVGSIETSQINTIPALLKPYTALIEAIVKHGGEVKSPYGSTVDLSIPKDRVQLQAQLESEQREWDRQEELYQQVKRGEPLKHSYQEHYLEDWAKAEGLPAPEFVRETEDADV